MKKSGVLLATCFLGLTITACSSTSSIPAGSAGPMGSGSGSSVTRPAAPAGSAELPSPGSAVQPTGSGSGSSADPNSREYRDCTVTVLDYTLCTDHDGETAVRVSFRFKNNSPVPASFGTTVIPNAFQGTSRDMLRFSAPARDDAEYSAQLRLLDPGESIICAAYFKLLTEQLPVELEVRDLRDSSAEALSRRLEIAGMPVEDGEASEPQLPVS